MRNILIVASGKAQSGKTTFSQILRDYIHNKDISEHMKDENSFTYLNAPGVSRVQVHSFATALKDIAKKYFNWDGSKENVMLPAPPGTKDATELPAPDKGRQLLINIGKKFREIRPSIWLDYVINEIKRIDKEKDTVDGTIFVIDDLRFKNELILSKTFHSCVSVRITRKEGALNLDDISETDLDDASFDYYIENDGTKEEFREKIAKLYDDIIEKYNDPAYRFQNVKFSDKEAAEIETQVKKLNEWSA